MKLITLPSQMKAILTGILLLLVFAFRVLPLLTSKNARRTDVPLGARRDYGIGGGAICPKCHRPFSISMLPIKVGFGTKLARCEFCGQWSFVRHRSLDELRAAEDAELAEAQPERPIPAKSEADRLKDQVENSRFTE
jgi:hypothetical protein